MKKLLLSFTMIVFSVCIYAQDIYVIKKTGSQYTSAQISAAFNNADFCGSYFQTKRNKITFNDGSEVELKSATELQSEGISFPINCVLNDNQHFYQSIWTIAENGMILKGSDTQLYESEKEYQRYKIEQ